MAGHQPKSNFSAERSQLYKSVLWLNPGKATDSKGELLISFVRSGTIFWLQVGSIVFKRRVYFKEFVGTVYGSIIIFMPIQATGDI